MLARTFSFRSTQSVTGEFSGFIAQSSDDAHEAVGGGTPVLNAVNIGIGTMVAGWRWAGFSIPQGATITRADILFVPDFGASNALYRMTIWCQDTAAPATFTTAVNNLTGRTKTTASIFWPASGATNAFPVWTADTANANSTTPDFSAVVQELVDSFTITAIVVICERSSGAVDKNPSTFDHTTNNAPFLTLEWTA